MKQSGVNSGRQAERAVGDGGTFFGAAPESRPAEDSLEAAVAVQIKHFIDIVFYRCRHHDECFSRNSSIPGIL